ncbi:protein NLRC5-like [Branchiostoma floridae]|uniref:Protein NLRC5-like n=1 Tax=Branchiostoma floridae TaxID=7739 RepID=A0A9J7HSD9_BRAFL|nr:protein NLRC5-like [Branchiostoma floridae]
MTSSFLTSTRRTTRIFLSSVNTLVPYFQSLKSLVELRFDFLQTVGNSLSMLLQGLASLPAKSTEAGRFPPLEILCCSNCHLTTQDIKALVGQLQTFQNLKQIDLSHNSINDEAVPGLAEGLSSCQNLKKVNFSHNKLSDRGDFLPPLPNLEEIDLSHNAISDEAVPGLAEGFGSCQNLKHVHFSNNKISNEGALLLLLQDQCKRVQVETAGNNISDDLVSLLSNRENASQTLEEIDLSRSDLTDEAGPGLVQILGSCQKLKKVNLSFNKLSDRGDFLPPLPNLEEIDLSHNAISDEAVPGLAEGFGSCQNLKHVHFSNNKISNEGALLLLLQDQCKRVQVETAGNNISDDLVSLLSNRENASQTLEEIDLSRSDLTDEAGPGLVQILGSCQKLKKVNLSFNKLSDRGDFLPPLPNLEEIDLSHNAISDEAVPGLAKGLTSCPNLRTVNLFNNTISNKGALMLLLEQSRQLRVEIDYDINNSIFPDLQSLLSRRTDASQVTKLDLTFGQPSGRDVSPHVTVDQIIQRALHLSLSLPVSAVHLLLQFLPQLPNLQELALCVSCQGEEEAELIGQLYEMQPPLKCLRLMIMDWSFGKMTRLLTLMFQQFPMLEAIDLRSSDIGDEAVSVLNQGLASCQNLKKVNLSHNKFSDTGFLPPLPNLEEIDLSHNAISDEAVPGLAEGLGSCQNLKKLNLSYNKLSVRGDFLPPLSNLEEIDLSHNVISDEAVPGLAEGLGSCQNLKKLNLSYNKLSVRGDFLPPLSNLEEIDLSHNAISDGAVPDLAECLASCQNLKKVNLSHNKLSVRRDFLPPLPNLEEIDLSNNAISVEAVPGLAEGLASCPNMRTVNLSDNNISNKGALLLLLEQPEQLQVEIISNNSISPDLRSLLTRRTDASQVTKLDLTSRQFSWRDEDVSLPVTAVHLLVQFLPQLPNLQELALCVSCQGEEEAEHINQLYGVRHLLKKLKLEDWSLGNMIRLLTQMLQHLTLLEEIDLSYNDISDEAVPGLAEGLGSCQNLKKVNLSHNMLSDRGDFLPPLPNLEEIDLSHNVISDEAVPSLAEGLGSYQNLKKVDLSGNNLPDVRELAAVFINLPKLTRVDIANNSIRDESLPTIAAWLKVCTCVERVDLYGNNFSAEGVRDFVRTMKGKAYRDSWLLHGLLYDGSQADVSEDVESGGEDVRREEQQWERLRRETGWIYVRVGQLVVVINHTGSRSKNLQLKPLTPS